MTIRQLLSQYQMRRINNPNPQGGPELYEITDEFGRSYGTSRDAAGAESIRDALMRKNSGLGKRPAPIKKAARLLEGLDYPLDDRLRNTTGGTGGTGGPGNG